MIIYGIKNCDTMKKAFDWLNENKIPYTFHNYKDAGISKTKLGEWLKTVPLTTLLNTKGTTYRALSDDEKRLAQDKQAAITLMTEHTSLIKRPVIEYKGRVLAGFNADEWQQQLL